MRNSECACYQYVGDNPKCPVHGEAVDEPTPTQKIYAVSELDVAHQQAIVDLKAAMRYGDIEAARQVQSRIQEIEARQRLAHSAARRHILSKNDSQRARSKS